MSANGPYSDYIMGDDNMGDDKLDHNMGDDNMLEEMCTELEETYDVAIIETFSPELIRAFKKEAQKCTKGRVVLARLINNYYKKQDPTIDPKQLKPVTRFIKGPKNLTVHWSRYYNKLIYIFGEFHITPDCSTHTTSTDPSVIMNIEDYLDQLRRNSDTFFEMAVEVPTTGRKKNEYYSSIRFGNETQSLNKIFKKFKHCIATKERKADDCQLGRIHFIDVRYENYTNIDNLSHLWRYFMYAGVDKIKIARVVKNEHFYSILKNLQQRFVGDMVGRIIRYFKVYIYGNPYNVVELDRLKNSKYKSDNDMAVYIQRFFDFEIQSLVIDYGYYEILKESVTQLMTFIEKYKRKSFTSNDVPPYIILSFNKLDACITQMAAISPDVYTLCRLFKTFNLEKPAFDGAIPKDQPKESNNIIIYAGNTHSQRYRKFLQFLQFREVGKTGQSDNDPNACIDMEYIKQPFFEPDFESILPQNKEYSFNYDFKHAYNFKLSI